MKARIRVTPKPGVLDPQGNAIKQALNSLGFTNVKDVRQGKYIELDLHEDNRTKVDADANSMCKKLLANTVIEDYSIEVEDD